MPLPRDEHYENKNVVQQKESRRKYGVQNDDEYVVTGNISPERGDRFSPDREIGAQRQRGGKNHGNDKYENRTSSSSSGIKKMERGISKAENNETLVIEARYKLEKDFGSLGLGLNSLRRRKDEESTNILNNKNSPGKENVSSQIQRRGLIKDGYEDDTSGSSGNTVNSPSHLATDETSLNRSPQHDRGTSDLNTANLIETPVYTFVLPDITIYPGQSPLKIRHQPVMNKSFAYYIS